MAGAGQVRREGERTGDKEEGTRGGGGDLALLILICFSWSPAPLGPRSWSEDHRESQEAGQVGETGTQGPPTSIISTPKPTGSANRTFTCLHPSCEVTRTEPCPAQLSLPGPIPLCTGRAWGTGLSPRLRLGGLGGTAWEAGPGAGTIPPGQAGLGPPVQVLERGGEWGAGGVCEPGLPPLSTAPGSL